MILVLFFVFFSAQKNISVPKPNFKDSEFSAESAKNTKSITVIVGDKILHLTSHPDNSLYDILLSAKNSGQIQFSGHTYPKLGFFVTDIGSLHNGNGEYLFYYINNKEAQVGVSSYIPKDGDVISWKLK